jgi:hypothetical protein
MAAAQLVGQPLVIHQPPQAEQPKAVDVKGFKKEVKVFRGLANPYLTVTLLAIAVLSAVAVSLYTTGQFQKWMSPARFLQFKKYETLFLAGTISFGVFSLALGGLSLAQAIDVYRTNRYAKKPDLTVDPNASEVRPLKELMVEAKMPKELDLSAEGIWGRFLNPPQIEEDGEAYFDCPSEEQMSSIGLGEKKRKKLFESFRWAHVGNSVCLDDIKNGEGQWHKLVFAGSVVQVSTGREINIVVLNPLPTGEISADQLTTAVKLAYATEPKPAHFVCALLQFNEWKNVVEGSSKFDKKCLVIEESSDDPVSKAFLLEGKTTLFINLRSDGDLINKLFTSTTLSLFSCSNADQFDALYHPGLAVDERGNRIDLSAVEEVEEEDTPAPEGVVKADDNFDDFAI